MIFLNINTKLSQKITIRKNRGYFWTGSMCFGLPKEGGITTNNRIQLGDGQHSEHFSINPAQTKKIDLIN